MKMYFFKLVKQDLLKEIESIEHRLIVTEYNYDKSVENYKELKLKYDEIISNYKLIIDTNKKYENKNRELTKEIEKLRNERESTKTNLIKEKDHLDNQYNTEIKMKEEEINQLQQTSTTYLKTIEQQSELYSTYYYFMQN